MIMAAEEPFAKSKTGIKVVIVGAGMSIQRFWHEALANRKQVSAASQQR
jgi:hypothetical protein